jgi:hypothetical protein
MTDASTAALCGMQSELESAELRSEWHIESKTEEPDVVQRPVARVDHLP